jgi:hypothetical protein
MCCLHCINAFHLPAWLKARKDPSDSTADASGKVMAGGNSMNTSEKAATRRLMNLFHIRSETRLGSSISSLVAKKSAALRANSLSHEHKRWGVLS